MVLPNRVHGRRRGFMAVGAECCGLVDVGVVVMRVGIVIVVGVVVVPSRRLNRPQSVLRKCVLAAVELDESKPLPMTIP